MNSFTIQPEMSWYTNPTTNTRQRGLFVKKAISAFFHADYSGGGMWQTPNTIENMIWTLKNDVTPFPSRLPVAKQQLSNILLNDLPQVLKKSGLSNLTVCVIPRSKKERHYRVDQLYFRLVVSDVLSRLNGFTNGTKYIIRHTNTRTTHLDRNGEGGDGHLPYPGIAKDTCTISENVIGRNILLIDDLYTRTVNIDEDAIQALLDKGASSVLFYAIGNTKSRSSNLPSPPSYTTSETDDLPF